MSFKTGQITPVPNGTPQIFTINPRVPWKENNDKVVI